MYQVSTDSAESVQKISWIVPVMRLFNMKLSKNCIYNSSQYDMNHHQTPVLLYKFYYKVSVLSKYLLCMIKKKYNLSFFCIYCICIFFISVLWAFYGLFGSLFVLWLTHAGKKKKNVSQKYVHDLKRKNISVTCMKHLDK